MRLIWHRLTGLEHNGIKYAPNQVVNIAVQSEMEYAPRHNLAYALKSGPAQEKTHKGFAPGSWGTGPSLRYSRCWKLGDNATQRGTRRISRKRSTVPRMVLRRNLAGIRDFYSIKAYLPFALAASCCRYDLNTVMVVQHGLVKMSVEHYVPSEFSRNLLTNSGKPSHPWGKPLSHIFWLNRSGSTG
jgi:hypothetical protein